MAFEILREIFFAKLGHFFVEIIILKSIYKNKTDAFLFMDIIIKCKKP